LVKVHVFVEGGGDQEIVSRECRRGFREFFSKVLPKGRQPRITACGSRDDTFDTFKSAIDRGESDVFILLVDAEEPWTGKDDVWTHLKQRDPTWAWPEGVTEDQIHLMVRCMEAWLVADPDVLEGYYGQGFVRNALPRRRNVEDVTKQQVEDALKQATRNTKTKGEYHKTKHGFDLLALIRPEKVRAASPHADRLCKVLVEKAGA
jgi:hypothetical protein